MIKHSHLSSPNGSDRAQPAPRSHLGTPNGSDPAQPAPRSHLGTPNGSDRPSYSRRQELPPAHPGSVHSRAAARPAFDPFGSFVRDATRYAERSEDW